MRHLLLSFILLFGGISAYAQNQGIGIGTTTPHSSAALEVADTSKGILIPRMTMNQRLAIQNPAEGLMVYQTDSIIGCWFFSMNTWTKLSIKEYYSGSGISIKNDTISVINLIDFNTAANKSRIGFSSSGNWVCPIGVTQVVIELWGAGGNSSSSVTCGASCCNPGCINSQFGKIGGKGGYNKQMVSVIPGSTYSITVGVAGGGGTFSGRVANGGASSFENLIFAEGGIGGGINYCSGCYSVGGPNGIDGAVINFTHPTSQIITPSYIPQSYITNSYPQCCAPAATNGFAVISY